MFFESIHIKLEDDGGRQGEGSQKHNKSIYSSRTSTKFQSKGREFLGFSHYVFKFRIFFKIGYSCSPNWYFSSNGFLLGLKEVGRRFC